MHRIPKDAKTSLITSPIGIRAEHAVMFQAAASG